VQVTPLPFSIACDPHTFAYRMAVTALPSSPSREQFTVYADLYGAVTGPVLTELATYSSGRLMPRTTELRSVKLLVRQTQTLLGSGT
jgi:hypothetical protein